MCCFKSLLLHFLLILQWSKGGNFLSPNPEYPGSNPDIPRSNSEFPNSNPNYQSSNPNYPSSIFNNYYQSSISEDQSSNPNYPSSNLQSSEEHSLSFNYRPSSNSEDKSSNFNYRPSSNSEEESSNVMSDRALAIANSNQDLDNDLTKEVGVSKLLDSKEVAARNVDGHTDHVEGRTLGVVADIFLSAHCFSSDCRRSPKRAEFCCIRNFNKECCLLASSYNDGFYNNRPSANPFYPSYTPGLIPGYAGGVGAISGGVPISSVGALPTYPGGIGGGLSGTLGGGIGAIPGYAGGLNGGYSIGGIPPYTGYGGGYIDKKPGFCPPAKEYGLDGFGGSIQDLYFGLRHHHDKKHVTEGTGGTTYPDLIDESYFLDPSDRDLSKTSQDLQRDESVMSHSKDWDESSVTSHSRDWSTAATKDRVWDESVTSHNREKKSVTFPDEKEEKAEGSEADVIIHEQERIFPSLLRFKLNKLNHLAGVETCRYDSHCLGPQKCCMIQIARYQFGMGCRYPVSDAAYLGTGLGTGYLGAGLGAGYLGAGVGAGYLGAGLGAGYLGAGLGAGNLGVGLGAGYLGNRIPPY